MVCSTPIDTAVNVNSVTVRTVGIKQNYGHIYVQILHYLYNQPRVRSHNGTTVKANLKG